MIMNYVITGSLGNISKPIVEQLVKHGHQVSVVSSNPGNKLAIEAIGAKSLIGSVEDAEFVNKSFAGADAVYLMVPPNWTTTDFFAYQQKVADNYAASVKTNGVKYVVQLSSIGAHMRKGAGPIDGVAYLEEKLEQLEGINALFLRPSYFFNNLYSQADLVKKAGIFGANHGGQEKLVLTDTDEIAAVAADALLKLDFTGHSVKYIANDERTGDEIARVFGDAIGKPGTPWVVFSDEQSYQGMLDAGLSPTMAEAYTQMGKSINDGRIQEDYWKNKPTPGKMKLEDFAKRFATVYAQ
jgi:uncharacterized protein YbjT (DUF2867 family)